MRLRIAELLGWQCVCHTLFLRFCSFRSTSTRPAADKQTLANKAMLVRWIRSETSDRVPAKKLLITVHSFVLLPWCFPR